MKDNMRLYELTINESGIRIRHASPHPLTANQKFYIIITGIVSAASCAMVLGFFSLLT